jgi:lipopolysaccharide export system protein LptA
MSDHSGSLSNIEYLISKIGTQTLTKYFLQLAIIAAIAPALPMFAQTPLIPDLPEAQIRANVEQYDFDSKEFTATGNVNMSYKGMTITGDSVSGSPWTGEIQASGSVTLSDSSNRVTCDSLQLYMQTPEATGPQTNTFKAWGNVQFTQKDDRLFANSASGNLMTGDFAATGGVHIYFQGTTLSADSVTGSNSSGEVTATGHVVFVNSDRQLTGNTFHYNYKTNIGKTSNASASADLLPPGTLTYDGEPPARAYFHGDEMSASPNRYELTNAIFTTCDRPAPHYYLSARSMVLIPGKEFTAHDVSVVFLGTRLFTLPSYKIKLDDEQESKRKTNLPPLAFSGEFGIYTGHRFELSQGPDYIGNLDLRIGTLQFIQAGVDYTRIAGQPFFARVGYRESFYGGTQTDTLLTRLPEVGVRYCWGKSAQQFVGGTDPIGLGETLIDPLVTRLSAYHTELSDATEIGVGHFTEDPSHITNNRFDARSLFFIDSIPIDSNSWISPSVLTRISLYDNGDTYSSLGGSLSFTHKISKSAFASLTYLNFGIGGQTPFHWDAIQLSNELALLTRFRFGDYRFRILTRYDLNAQSVYDTEFTLSKTIHCLEPSISWDNRAKEFSIGMGLTGF